ncbi:MAG: polyprenol monophosphomannose synthase [Bacteroidetes bacterium]|nr:polyprenol monophosphomannose synthase [Bacteroidota bacterium]
MDKLVVIPTYNEKENIANMARAVMALPGNFHLLVVDDGSPDGTASIVRALQQEFPDSLFMQERSGKLGLGTAYIHGFKWALQHGYQFIFEMDADFSHDPKDLLRLHDACALQGADMSIGSRYVKGGRVENWPKDRIFISKGGALYTRIITRMPVKDPTAGFVCYTRRVLEALPLDDVRFVGYAFQIEMKYRAWKMGFKLREVPIKFIDRIAGASKMSKGIVQEAMKGVWKMRGFLK